MPFVTPNFNLKCNVGRTTSVFPSAGPGVTFFSVRLANQPCALVYGERVSLAASGGSATTAFPELLMNLLLPALTDIRGPQQSPVSQDMVEVPAGSGRTYYVMGVDDIGKGHGNEHRTALLVAIRVNWTSPYP